MKTGVPEGFLPKMYSDAWFANEGTTIVMHRSVPLIRFKPKKLTKKKMNLLSGEMEDEPAEEEKPQEEDSDEGVVEDRERKPVPYIQYLKPEIYCYIVPDFTVYTKNSVPDQFKSILKINTEMNFYEPLISLTDFWAYDDILVELNNTVKSANVTVHIKPNSLMKTLLIEQFETTNKFYKEWGMDNNMDMTKKMLGRLLKNNQ
jgi:hypothetical protein